MFSNITVNKFFLKWLLYDERIIIWRFKWSYVLKYYFKIFFMQFYKLYKIVYIFISYIIAKLLNHVCDRLQNAHSSASLHVLRRFKYFYVTNLVEYFQMEVRWSLRKLLIEAFLLMCYMDAKIISLMLSSVLPLELVQDIYQTKVTKKEGNCFILENWISK